MSKKNLNDFIIDIYQDFCEVESLLKIIKDATNSQNIEANMSDIGNSIEIIITKISNTKYSLNKYIDSAFK